MSLKNHIKELNDQRVAKIAEARKMLVDENGATRALSDEDKDKWDRMMADVDDLKSRMDRMSRQDELDEEEAARGDEEVVIDPAVEDEDEREDNEEDEQARSSVVRLADGRMARVLRPGEGRVSRSAPGARRGYQNPFESPEERRTRVRRSSNEYRAAFANYAVSGSFGRHARAVNADVDVQGGYMVMPQQFVWSIIKFVDDEVFLRKLATKFQVLNAQSLGAPSFDTDISDSDWTSELATGNEDSSTAFGKRELVPHPLAKRLKVSNKLLRLAAATGVTSADGSSFAGGVEGFLRSRLGYKFGVTQEKAGMTGNGSQKWLGLFTASTRGISTARDVQTGSTTSITADQLIAAKYSLKPQYQKRSQWIFHRDAVKIIRQLKDGMGQYLWQPGLVAAQPDTLLELPVNQSEYAPNTFTTGQYVGILGDFSFYWIADSENMTIQRLVELYAETNQVGFIARQESDGMPVLEEAFARLITN